MFSHAFFPLRPSQSKIDEVPPVLLSAIVQLKTGNRDNFAAKKRFGSQALLSRI
jgi:hypothetical protein